MTTKQNPGNYDSYANADWDEEMFILLARDPLAPILVDLWASLHEQKIKEHVSRGDISAIYIHKEYIKIDEARECANKMRAAQQKQEAFSANERRANKAMGPNE